VFADREPQIMV